MTDKKPKIDAGGDWRKRVDRVVGGKKKEEQDSREEEKRKNPEINGESFWQGGYSGFNTHDCNVARTQEEWEDMWVKAHLTETPDATPPGPLPEGAMAVAVFAGQRSSGGYAIEIEGTHEEDGKTIVDWRENTPKQGGGVNTGALTTPWGIKLVPATENEVTFKNLDSKSEYDDVVRRAIGRRMGYH